MTLQASVDLVSRASDADIPIEDALHWSAHEYATVHYEVGGTALKAPATYTACQCDSRVY